MKADAATKSAKLDGESYIIIRQAGETGQLYGSVSGRDIAEAIGEALSLTANQLLLRDEGRPKAWASPNKPEGSVHGDSVGLHCCDTIHAWRNLAAAGDQRTRVTSLIIAGYQVARDRGARAEFTKWDPYPRAEHRDKVKGVAADALLK